METERSDGYNETWILAGEVRAKGTAAAVETYIKTVSNAGEAFERGLFPVRKSYLGTLTVVAAHTEAIVAAQSAFEVDLAAAQEACYKVFVDARKAGV